MSISRTSAAELDRLDAWRHAPLTFPGGADEFGSPGDEPDSDWDEVHVLNLIEREGSIRAEDIGGDWE